ncbi:flavodoxin [Eubacteriaceae bacterium ES2]|nr:flavodoxin [Eubacteriaceae bacterium ES2]
MVFTLAACGSSQISNSGQAEESDVLEQTDNTNSEEALEASQENDSDSTVLVLYYDYSENMGDTSGMDVDAITSASLAGESPTGVDIGNLLVIADEIQNKTGSDIFSVRANETYDPSFGEMVDVAQDDQNNDKQFTFVEDIQDLSGYDTIYIGLPVWWSKIPQPMKVFLEQHDFSGKTLIPFGIHRGSRFGQMIGQLSELAPGATVVEDGYTVNATTANDEVRDEVDSWIQNMN